MGQVNLSRNRSSIETQTGSPFCCESPGLTTHSQTREFWELACATPDQSDLPRVPGCRRHWGLEHEQQREHASEHDDDERRRHGAAKHAALLPREADGRDGGHDVVRGDDVADRGAEGLCAE